MFGVNCGDTGADALARLLRTNRALQELEYGATVNHGREARRSG